MYSLLMPNKLANGMAYSQSLGRRNGFALTRAESERAIMSLPNSRLLSARDLALETLRERIYSDVLTSGARISVQELADELRISRTPVREAAWQLAAEGLVEVRARVGFFVREISAKEVLDIYDIRLMLEPLMAASAAQRGSPHERQSFHESVALLESALQQSKVREYVSVVEQRRGALLEMSKNRPLGDTLLGMDSRVRLLRMRNLSQDGALSDSLEQHREIAEAVAIGDPQLAYRAMADHVTYARDRMRRMLTSPLDGTRGDEDTRSPIEELIATKSLFGSAREVTSGASRDPGSFEVSQHNN